MSYYNGIKTTVENMVPKKMTDEEEAHNLGELALARRIHNSLAEHQNGDQKLF